MQFVSEYSAPKETLDEIYSFLDKSDVAFQDSKLYDSLKEEKFVDKSLRLSEFRELRDDAIFSLSDRLVDIVNENERDQKRERVFSLVRNDVTHIKYSKGGFFKRHADFLSLTSNVVEEYTLILCVTPPGLAKETQGGETIIHINEGATSNADAISHVSKATTTPGHFLLFRKDMDHEGALLTEGEKHILTFNLWCTTTAGGDVLVVTFPKEKEEVKKEREAREKELLESSGKVNAKSDEEGEKEKLLLSLSHSNLSRTYVIPVSKLRHFPDSLLASYVWFDQMDTDKTEDSLAGKKAAAGTTTRSRGVITFECLNATYASFSVIYRVLMGMYVSPEEVRESAYLLTYYNIPASHILVAFSSKNVERKTIEESKRENGVTPAATLISGDSEEDGDFFPEDPETLGEEDGDDEMVTIAFDEIPSTMPASLAVRRMEKQVKEVESKSANEEDEVAGLDDPTASSSESPFKQNIIVCATAQRTKLVASLARDLGLPYVPFRIFFVEGAAQYGGGMSGDEPKMISMRPLWVSMGSYDNILFLEQIMTSRGYDGQEESSKYEPFAGDVLFTPREKKKLEWGDRILCEITEEDCNARKEGPNHKWRLHGGNFDENGKPLPSKYPKYEVDPKLDHVPSHSSYYGDHDVSVFAGRLRFALDPASYHIQTEEEKEEEQKKFQEEIQKVEKELEEYETTMNEEEDKRKKSMLEYTIIRMKENRRKKLAVEAVKTKKWRGFRDQVMDITAKEANYSSLINSTPFITLPSDLDMEVTGSAREEDKGKKEVETMQSQFKSKFFHFDSTGSSCFSLAEAEATTEWAKGVNFPELVRQTLNDTPFELPQVCMVHMYGNDMLFALIL